jgi:hypothetical protein
MTDGGGYQDNPEVVMPYRKSCNGRPVGRASITAK